MVTHGHCRKKLERMQRKIKHHPQFHYPVTTFNMSVLSYKFGDAYF